MASDIVSRRVPWVAVALSLLSAGVGHLYCGRIVKGLLLYFAWLLVPLCATIASLVRPSATGLALLLLPAIAVVLVYLYSATDAWRLAYRNGSDYHLRDYNRAAIYGVLIVVQVLCSIGTTAGARRFVYEAFAIPADSMSPNIIRGDRILARKLLPQDRVAQRGDLIVYRNPMPTGASRFVGRVVAVAGDQIEIRGERLLINGNELVHESIPVETSKALDERAKGRVVYEVNSDRRYIVAYGDSSDGGHQETGFDATVPQRHVFVLGDNRDLARDSRHFGSIQSREIVGYVDYVFWPSESWSRFGVVR